MTQIEFLNAFASRIPAVALLLREHVDDFEEVLPTVLMGSIARLYCEACRRDWPGDADLAQQVSDYLETGLGTSDESLRDLIMLGFVENLMGETDVPSIRARLGPQLAKALRDIYPETCDNE
jgi:hypothetical protein